MWKKKKYYATVYSPREGCTWAPIGRCRMTQAEEAGRVGLIGVVFSDSLLRDQDRQLRGGLNVQPGQSEGLPWTHTHDSEVSRGLWSYLWCGDCEWIHPLAVKRETKTLSRVWGAVEFDRRGGLPPYRVRSAVRAGVIETHTHQYVLAVYCRVSLFLHIMRKDTADGL